MRLDCLNLRDINDFQQEVMGYIDWWVRDQKTCVPLKQIIAGMKKSGYKSFTTVNALNTLIKRGYIRRSVVSENNRTTFVQLRRVTACV